jgi:hypothetical protein
VISHFVPLSASCKVREGRETHGRTRVVITVETQCDINDVRPIVVIEKGDIGAGVEIHDMV